jgi:hypothetical protein
VVLIYLRTDISKFGCYAIAISVHMLIVARFVNNFFLKFSTVAVDRSTTPPNSCRFQRHRPRQRKRGNHTRLQMGRTRLEYDPHNWLYQRRFSGPKQRQNHHGALATAAYISTTMKSIYKPTSVFNKAGQECVIPDVPVSKGTEMIDFDMVEVRAFWEYHKEMLGSRYSISIKS